uniref:C2h2-type zn-finger protein n=1 Tax=Culex tarsalis TaxID=7177 RepID=A0A1Q3FWB4_CULTA
MPPPPMENLCRICARSEEDRHAPLVCVFGTTVELDQRTKSGGQQPWPVPEEDGILVQTVAQVMASCLDVEIKASDQLPQRICSECLTKLRESWALKETSKVSEKQLRRMLLEVTREEVKREEPAEDDDIGQDVCFIAEDESEDEKMTEDMVQLLSPPRKINPEDPLHSELGWYVSDLPKGRFRSKPGDNATWDRLEVEDFRCCGCFKFFDSKLELERHCKQDHKEEPAGRNKRYECSVCLKLFASTDALSFHQKMARSRVLLHCLQCHVLSPSKRQLMAHLKLHAQGKLDMVPVAASPIKKEDRPPLSVAKQVKQMVEMKRVAVEPPPVDKCREVKKFVTFDYYTFDGFCCCDCWTYCETKREMKRHGEKEHFGNRGFEEDQTCFACWRSFADKSTYDAHVALLNTKHLYYCKPCQLPFRTSDQLQEHQQTSGLHEGFIELEIIDIKEEVETEEPTAVEVAPESDGDDADYDPNEGGSKRRDFVEPYGRRLYAPPGKGKKNEQDLVEASVVEVTNQDAVRCCGCYRTFITEEELADHCASEHLPVRVFGDKNLPYECERCFRRFSLATALTIHQNFVGSVREFACKLCEQKFSFQTPFLMHLTRVHEFFHVQKRVKRGAPKTDPPEDNKYHCCFMLCKQSYDEYGDLLCHVDEVHGLKRNQFKDYRDSDENCCEICFRSLNNYGALVRHSAQRRRIRQAVMTCSTCGHQSKSVAELKDHENKHLGLRPYECELCKKTFSSKTILKNHMLVHVTDRPFSCEICGKTFARKRNWKDHRASHLESKPWECEICKMQFRIETQFMTHKKRHTGVRPYKCGFCEKVFSHATDRKRHEMAAHTGEKPHQCSFCALAFIRKRQLIIHERTHTGEKPFECQYCSQAFIQQSYLTRHLATHKM